MPEQIAKLKSKMEQSYHMADKPLPGWQLSNNNAEIRRLKARIGVLTRQQETVYVDWQSDGGTVY